MCAVGGSVLISTAIAQQQPSLVVAPSTGVTISGPKGGPFSPPTFEYHVRASSGAIKFWVSTPAWLTAIPHSGTADSSGVKITVAVNSSAFRLGPGVYGPAVGFRNVTNGEGSTTRTASLTVKAAAPPTTSPTTGNLLGNSGDILLDDHGRQLLPQ